MLTGETPAGQIILAPSPTVLVCESDLRVVNSSVVDAMMKEKLYIINGL